MFDAVILGVDPGTAAVGLAVVVREGPGFAVSWAETLATPRGLPAAERLGRIHAAIRRAIRAHRPAAVALERLMWGRNAGSGMEVARASGAIMVAAAQMAVPVHEYAPLEVKMAVTGVGNATKTEVRRALARILRVRDVPPQADAADAVAVAVCHLQQSRLRVLTARAAR